MKSMDINKQINIIYIVDSLKFDYKSDYISQNLSKIQLDENIDKSNIKFGYIYINLGTEPNRIEKLLEQINEMQANIIIFNANQAKLEKIEVILTGINPYIDLIFVPQNINLKNYFHKQLEPNISNSIKNIYKKRVNCLNLKSKKLVDETTITKMEDLLNGIFTYSNLNNKNIDELIDSTKK